MLISQLAKRYAKAIFEVALDDGKVKEYGDELNAMVQSLEDNSELRDFVNNPLIQPENKKAVMAKLVKDELSSSVYNFLMLLIDKRRESLLSGIAVEYEVCANEALNIVVAEVTVALPLYPEQEKELAAKLGEVTGKKVMIETKIDKNILGGVVVRVGDMLIDGSVVRQLQTLKERLLA